MSHTEKHRIFLSCGAPYTSEQGAFVSAIEDYLSNHDCETQTVGRRSFSVRQPVQFARNLIADCDGVVVIAFERLLVDKGRDKPGSTNEKAVDGRLFPTVWNQMEAAMAYAHDLPILTLVAKGLYRQGMLSDRLEWFAQEVDLKPEFLATDQFHQVFTDWLGRVEERKKTPWRTKLDPSKLRMADLFMVLTPKQLWGLVAATVAVLTVVAGVAYKLGAFFKKP
jgi:hypothetical protein